MKILSVDDVLTRGIDRILPSKAKLALFMERKKITLYQGFDPSMPSLHLGNLVGLIKLSQFQKLGHKVIFLIGDFTGMIGDPTDKSSVRKKLTRSKVIENARSWKEQASKVLDFSGINAAKIMYNSSWSDKITFKDLIEITSHLTVQQLLERDMFQERIEKEKPIHLHEFLYPVAQGYDSVAMDVDLEIGGSDQFFNMMTGRVLLKTIKGKEKYVLATKLLVDKKGEKVGKTAGNALFLNSQPTDFYAGIMSFPDESIELGFELLTELSLIGLKSKIKKDPMSQKKNLAYEVVKLLWGEASAFKAQSEFENVFQSGHEPKKPMLVSRTKNSDLITTMAENNIIDSKSEAKRLISQGAVDVDGKVIKNPSFKLKGGELVKIGKYKFVKIK